MQVMVNLHSAHMDPDDWQQPQQFRPERFLDESGNVVNRDQIIPFSLGMLTYVFPLRAVIFLYVYHRTANSILTWFLSGEKAVVSM